jgi:L-ascorbate metabolism protein UlaG (beta-lactamase superfamily)
MGPERVHEPPLPWNELPPLDAVLISHDHYDHLDMPTIRRLIDTDVPILVPLGVGAHLEHWQIPAERIIEHDWWDEYQLGDLRLVTTPARHFSGRSMLMTDRMQTLWAGWALIGPAHRIYYSGDTAMFPGFHEIGRRLGPFDATMIESGAYNQLWRDVHVGPEQAVQAHVMVGGKVMIPVHWGTFDLALHSWTEPVERVMIAAQRFGVTVATPQPGQSVEPATVPPPTRWWPTTEWETAEEAPVVSSSLNQALLPQPGS